MYFNIGRLFILLATLALTLILASTAWSAFPRSNLLEILWKFSFVAAVCAGIGYQLRSKYSDLMEHPSLSDSEFRRLASIITKRRSHITFFVLLGFVISLLLATSNLFNSLPKLAPWYFKLVTSALAVEVVVFIYILLSFHEIEAFKTRLDERNRALEEKKRLLDKFNSEKE